MRQDIFAISCALRLYLRRSEKKASFLFARYPRYPGICTKLPHSRLRRNKTVTIFGTSSLSDNFGTRDTADNVGGEELPLHVSAEPLVGYRTWRVSLSKTGKELVLSSVHMNFEWPRGILEAECRRNGMKVFPFHSDPAPNPDCSCGIYCQLPDQPFDEWEHYVRGSVRATGTVEMSGRIIQCKKGYKAGRVEIKSPIILEVNCAADNGFCSNAVTSIFLSQQNTSKHLGVCAVHESLDWKEDSQKEY